MSLIKQYISTNKDMISNNFIQLELVDIASFAVFNHYDVIQRLTVNDTMGGFTLILRKNSIFNEMRINIPSLGVGKIYQAPKDLLIPDIKWNYLQSLKEVETLHVDILLDDDYLETKYIKAYPMWIWPGLKYPESLAFFVEESEVLKQTFFNRLRQKFPELQSFQPYDKNINIGDILEIVMGIVRDANITYQGPKTVSELNFADQMVFVPSEVLIRRAGTQLEIAIVIASLLETAGINPLILFKPNHIMVGLWLNPKQFNSVWIEDHNIIIDLATSENNTHEYLSNEILFIDVLHALDKSHNFNLQQLCAYSEMILKRPGYYGCLDISRAKVEKIPNDSLLSKSRIIYPISDITLDKIEIYQKNIDDSKSYKKPKENIVKNIFKPLFQSNVEQYSYTDFERVVPSKQPDNLKVEKYNYTDFETAKPPSKIDNWKKDLLDLSFRNNYINFSQSKTQAKFVVNDMQQLYVDILSDKKFSIISGFDIIENDPSIQQDKDGNKIVDNAIYLNLARSNYADKKLVTKLSEQDLIKNLKTIDRARNAELQESGTNILFMIFGFFSYFSTTNNRTAVAPLITIPVNLTSTRSRKYTISLSDNDPRFNLTLFELLRRDYKIQGLDDLSSKLSQNKEKIKLEDLFHQFMFLSKDIENCELKRDVSLSNLNFSKFPMFKDIEELDKENKLLIANPVLNALITGNAQSFEQDKKQNAIELEKLDEYLDPKNIYTPLL
ncbi:MAG: DUF4011 domain-containing protein, partial [Clostridiales Family XIII bacterium]|nr:DUF4011 domain-containing protein [Clostridiales Family XIII bacterium]